MGLLNLLLIFIVGLIEYAVATLWTRSVRGTNVLAGGAITFVAVMLWYYVLRTVIQDLDNILVVLVYGLGCASGCILGMCVQIKKTREERKVGASFKLALLRWQWPLKLEWRKPAPSTPPEC